MADDRSDWYDRMRQDAAFRPRLITGTPFDRMAGLEPLLRLVHGGTVLDLGCHKGLVSYEMARSGARLVHGLDHHPPSVETARALLEECGIEACFEVFDLRGGGPALARWLGEHGRDDYDVVLFLGLHHHLARQMPKAALEGLVEELARRCRQLLAVRSPEADLAGLDAVLRREGLTLRHHSDLTSTVGPARIYRRE